MHLVKFIATAGVASRRKSEDLIKSGHVSIGGRTVTDPAKAVSDSDKVRVDNRLVTYDPRKYYALNKPIGVISTAKDTHGRKKVTDLIRGKGRLYPVGRLDADTSGLIILTNDGDLADKLTHPRYEVPKTYRVTVWRQIPATSLQRLRKGVELSDGVTLPAKAKMIREVAGNSIIELTLKEGRNRQVRRMMQALGHPVLGLQRIKLGTLQLGELPEGQARELEAREVVALRKLAAPTPRKKPATAVSKKPRRRS